MLCPAAEESRAWQSADSTLISPLQEGQHSPPSPIPIAALHPPPPIDSPAQTHICVYARRRMRTHSHRRRPSEQLIFMHLNPHSFLWSLHFGVCVSQLRRLWVCVCVCACVTVCVFATGNYTRHGWLREVHVRNQTGERGSRREGCSMAPQCFATKSIEYTEIRTHCMSDVRRK